MEHTFDMPNSKRGLVTPCFQVFESEVKNINIKTVCRNIWSFESRRDCAGQNFDQGVQRRECAMCNTFC